MVATEDQQSSKLESRQRWVQLGV